ncbi:Imm49 family immunity protein, partial [Vibrio parahaemolyticus]|uniref:Imm49 family immunity protein n=1 Tax=Vibrio parahaemolyticus TaxID=670 RepID=UPI0004A4F9A3
FAALTTNIGYDFEEVLVKNLQFQEKYHLRELGPDRIGIRTFINFPLLGMAYMFTDIQLTPSSGLTQQVSSVKNG